MTTLLDRRRTAVTTQLDAIENTETYEAERETDVVPANGEFLERRKLMENWIALCTLTFELICDLNREWRRRIFRGLEVLGSSENAAMRTLFERWDRVCSNEQIRRRLETYARELKSRQQALKGIEDYLECCRQADDLLARWTPPVVSKAVALQEGELSEEDLARLESLRQKGAAQLKNEPHRIR